MTNYKKSELTALAMTLGVIFFLVLLVFFIGMGNLNYADENKRLRTDNQCLKMQVLECNNNILEGTCLPRTPALEEMFYE